MSQFASSSVSLSLSSSVICLSPFVAVLLFWSLLCASSFSSRCFSSWPLQCYHELPAFGGAQDLLRLLNPKRPLGPKPLSTWPVLGHYTANQAAGDKMQLEHVGTCWNMLKMVKTCQTDLKYFEMFETIVANSASSDVCQGCGLCSTALLR